MRATSLKEDLLARYQVLRHSIMDICDGWNLPNGDLYLLVKCADGIIRPITVHVGKNK
jgi:hypothetical protein